MSVSRKPLERRLAEIAPYKDNHTNAVLLNKPESSMDSLIDGYLNSRALAACFGAHSTLEKMLVFEAALAKTQAALGIIPQAAADVISVEDHAKEAFFMKMTLESGGHGGFAGTGQSIEPKDLCTLGQAVLLGGTWQQLVTGRI